MSADDWKGRAVPNVVRRELQPRDVKALTARPAASCFDASDHERPARELASMTWVCRVLPPSANRLVRPAMVRGKARLVKTGKIAGTWRTWAQAELRTHWSSRFGVLRGVPVFINCEWVFATINSDGPNRDKALHDAMKGIVYVDDCQLAAGAWRKRLCRLEEAEHVIVRVSEYKSADRLLADRLLVAKKAGGVDHD